MPIYDLFCNDCKKKFERFCKFSEIKSTMCLCGSNNISQCPTVPMIVFKNPEGTSKMDNFDWQARWRYDKATNERRTAEEALKNKGHDSPYNNIDDISSGQYFGEVE